MSIIEKYLVLIAVIFSVGVKAQLKQTASNGAWESSYNWVDTIKPLKFDTISIEHYIRFNEPVTLNGNIVIISSEGELCGNDSLYIPGGTTIINYGNLCPTRIYCVGKLVNYGYIHANHLRITADDTYLGSFQSYNMVEVDKLTYSCFNRKDGTPVILWSEGRDTLKANILAETYEWTLNDSILSNGIQTIVPILYGHGEFRVRVRDAFNQFSEYSDAFSINQPRSKGPDLPKLSIYPNPSSDFFNLIISDNSPVTMIKLLSTTGNLIYSQTLFDSNLIFPLETRIKINLNSISSGVYLIQVFNEFGFTSKKVAVIK